MNNRELIGQGSEHRVFQSIHPNWVIKTETRRNILFTCLLRFPTHPIFSEYHEAKLDYEELGLRIPDTYLFAFNGGKNYIAVQQKINEDNSVQNIEQVLLQLGAPELAERYAHNPSSFKTYLGHIYIVDFTKSYSFAGLVDRLGLIKKKDLLRTRYRIRQAIRRYKRKNNPI